MRKNRITRREIHKIELKNIKIDTGMSEVIRSKCFRTWTFLTKYIKWGNIGKHGLFHCTTQSTH